MASSTKLVIYSSLIFLVLITIPPECLCKSLNTTTVPPPPHNTTTTTLNPIWYMTIKELVQRHQRMMSNSIKISEEGEIPEVYFDPETNSTWQWFPGEPVEQSFFDGFSEFVSEYITLILSFLAFLIFLVIIEAIRQACNRWDEEYEHGNLLNINIPKMAPV